MDPQYPTPAAPTPEGAPPAGGAPAGRGMKIALLVVAIVVLMLCCCGVGAAVYFFDVVPDEWFEDPGDPVPTNPVPADDPALTPDVPMTEDHREAWDSFSPQLTAMTQPGTARQQGIAQEVLGMLMPGFEVVEVLVEPGGMDEDGDYTSDYYLVRLRSLQDPAVELAYDFDVATQEAVDAGATWVVEELEDTQALGVLPDGTEFVYWMDLFPDIAEGSADSDYHALLSKVAEDWPGSVNTWLDWFEDDDYTEAWAYPTLWEQYADVQSFEGFEAGYELIDGEWVMFSWDSWVIDSE